MVKRNMKLSLIHNKNILKKLSACIMATSMVVSGLPVNMGINEKFEIEKVYASETLTHITENSIYEYELQKDGTVCITGYKGTDDKIIIPNIIDGKEVTSIQGLAFMRCTSLKEVVIQEGVTDISWIAFEGCSNLEKIIIPESVIKIDMFSGTYNELSGLKEIIVNEKNLKYKSVDGILFNKEMSRLIQYPAAKEEKKYIIPDGVKSIDGAFEGCSNLEEVIIPNSVVEMSGAFKECSSLEEIIIPEGVTYIGSSTFKDCSSLKKINIPTETTSIGISAFEGCKNLESIIIPEGVTSIWDYAFYGCSSLKEIIIPENVTSIMSEAFYECSSLKEIIIPEKVTEIGFYAFGNCSSLEKIEVSENNLNYMSESGVLFDKDMKTLIQYPSGRKDKKYIVQGKVEEIENRAFAECSTLEEVEIMEGVMKIGGEGFRGCKKLKKMIISKSVTSIFSEALVGCDSLEEIIVDTENMDYKTVDGVLFDKDMTILIFFPRAKKNVKYEIPISVTTIDDYAFSECTNLREIIIPDTVTTIEHYAFSECNNLKELIIPDGVTYIGWNAFFNCNNLREIMIPSGLKYIYSYMFSGCSSLEKVVIPKGVIDIGENVFEGCISLKEIILPEGMEVIRKRAFSGCNNLEKIIINKGIIGIDENAFEGCISLKEIILPEGMEVISNKVFSGCNNLEKIIIPASVKRLGENIFLNCNNIVIFGKKDSSIEIYAKNNNIPFIAINEITSSENITVIYQVDSIHETILLQANKITQEDEEYKNITFEGKIVDSSITENDVIFTAYDIALTDENNNKIKPSEVVTIKIPCLEGYNDEKCKVYRLNENGTFKDMYAYNADDCMVFDDKDFGTYIITETELITKNTISGDTNEDGEIDIKDSALIKRYLAGAEVELDLEAADVNGDGEVNIKDSALIKRQLAGWE